MLRFTAPYFILAFFTPRSILHPTPLSPHPMPSAFTTLITCHPNLHDVITHHIMPFLLHPITDRDRALRIMLIVELDHCTILLKDPWRHIRRRYRHAYRLLPVPYRYELIRPTIPLKEWPDLQWIERPLRSWFPNTEADSLLWMLLALKPGLESVQVLTKQCTNTIRSFVWSVPHINGVGNVEDTHRCIKCDDPQDSADPVYFIGRQLDVPCICTSEDVRCTCGWTSVAMCEICHTSSVNNDFPQPVVALRDTYVHLLYHTQRLVLWDDNALDTEASLSARGPWYAWTHHDSDGQTYAVVRGPHGPEPHPEYVNVPMTESRARREAFEEEFHKFLDGHVPY